MTTVDWIAAAVVGLAALNGLRRGLIAGALSLGGLVAGAYFGAKLAPQFLGGADSRYTPLVALGGAVAAATFVQSAAGMIGGTIRKTLFAIPPLRVLDTLGGIVLGAATGLALVWVAGAVALHVPGQTELRREVQRSEILQRLNAEVPPDRLMDAIARVDPFSAIRGPEANVPPPDPQLLAEPEVKAARPSVVRITGTACGLGIAGSGWVAGRDTVVTNAHVVAGMKDAEVEAADGSQLRATAVAFDARNDVAVLRVRGLDAPALQIADATEGTAVAILGFPDNGPFTATPGRIGQTTTVLADDAYGRGPFPRLVTTIRGKIRHGNSGGPAIDSAGRVQTTIFAARIGSDSGYGVPDDLVRRALAGTHTPVSTGPCAR
jgi:uncharacterized membrane protein required for colicin V production